MYCHKCGKENIDSAKFCKGCGVQLVDTQFGSSSRKNKTSPQIVILIVLSLGVLTAILTNPSEAEHKSAVADLLKQSAFENVLETATESENEFEIAGSALGYSLGVSFVDRIVEMGVTRNNYLLFSTTKFNYQGKSRTVGYGVFGNVSISKNIKRAMQE